MTQNTQQQNNNQPTTFRQRLQAALQRFTSRKIHPPAQPYTPQPGQNQTTSAFNDTGDYSETEIDVQQIFGYDIPFGLQKTIQINEHGHARELSQKPSYITGDGKRISDIDEIGGICPFCQQIAMEAYQQGFISIQEAQLKSLCHRKSAMQCSICGITTCSIHTRPIQTPEDVVLICTACQKKLKRRQRRHKLITFLLSPFMESKNEPCE